MDRFNIMLEAVNEVNARCQDIVDDVKGKKKQASEMNMLTEEEIQRSHESLYNDSRISRKRFYVDDELQKDLGNLRKDVHNLTDIKLSIELTNFLDEYERMLEKEIQLSSHIRHKELSDLHSHMSQQSVVAESVVAGLDWEEVTDEIGNPALHQQSEKSVQQLKDYISLEGKLVGLSNNMRYAKLNMVSLKQGRTKRKDSIMRNHQVFQNRDATSICQENIYKLSDENWLTMTKDEQAIALQKGMEDCTIVEKIYNNIKAKNEDLNEEYKELIKHISKKRTALLAHKGPKWAKEQNEKEIKEKEAYKATLEGHLKSMITAIVSNDKLQVKLKNERDQDLNQMRKLYAMLSGSPLSAVHKLEESLKTAGFDKFGRHNLKVGSADQNAWLVMDRLQESVAELYSVASTAVQREANLKMTTQLPPHRYQEKGEKIRKASKMPRPADDVMEVIEQLEKFLMANIKILKEFVEETNRFVQGDFSFAKKIADCDKAMTFDIGRVNALHFSLLNEQTLESCINATKVGILAPVVSQPAIGGKKKNKSGNKSVEPDSYYEESSALLSTLVSIPDNTESAVTLTEDTDTTDDINH